MEKAKKGWYRCDKAGEHCETCVHRHKHRWGTIRAGACLARCAMHANASCKRINRHKLRRRVKALERQAKTLALALRQVGKSEVKPDAEKSTTDAPINTLWEEVTAISESFATCRGGIPQFVARESPLDALARAEEDAIQRDNDATRPL